MAQGKCPVELKPMKEWVQGGDPSECRECLLAPVIQWYREELQEKGHADLATELTQAVNTADPLTLCEKLDTIKDAVEESLRERLKEFDCAAQTYEPE